MVWKLKSLRNCDSLNPATEAGTGLLGRWIVSTDGEKKPRMLLREAEGSVAERKHGCLVERLRERQEAAGIGLKN
jgi:hypothetical protein